MKTVTEFVVAITPLIFEKKQTNHTTPKKFVLLRLHPVSVIFKLKIQHTLEATQKFSTSVPCLEGKFQCIESLVRIYDTVTRCLFMGTPGFNECDGHASYQMRKH